MGFRATGRHSDARVKEEPDTLAVRCGLPLVVAVTIRNMRTQRKDGRMQVVGAGAREDGEKNQKALT